MSIPAADTLFKFLPTVVSINPDYPSNMEEDDKGICKKTLKLANYYRQKPNQPKCRNKPSITYVKIKYVDLLGKPSSLLNFPINDS